MVGKRPSQPSLKLELGFHFFGQYSERLVVGLPGLSRAPGSCIHIAIRVLDRKTACRFERADVNVCLQKRPCAAITTALSGVVGAWNLDAKMTLNWLFFNVYYCFYAPKLTTLDLAATSRSLGKCGWKAETYRN